MYALPLLGDIALLTGNSLRQEGLDSVASWSPARQWRRGGDR